MRRLILASTSPYRRRLLGRLGVAFEAVAPRGVDEERAKREEPTALAIAERLAREKATSVRARFPGALVVGSDQVGALDDPQAPRGFHLLDKPGTEARAIESLAALAGRELTLLTACCLLDVESGEVDVYTDITRIGFRALSRAEIADYVRRERPLDCAGSFKLEGLGAALMTPVSGQGPSAIVGLPILWLVPRLAARGLPVLARSTAADL